MLLLPTPVWHIAHGNSPELCRRSSTVPQIMIFVFLAFTLSPFSSIAPFQVKSLLIHSSIDSPMTTRSLAYRSSHGTPQRNSRDKASSTMMKSSRLSTEPWSTPTFTSNSSLYPSPIRTRLLALKYIPWTVTLSTHPHQVSSVPTKWPSGTLGHSQESLIILLSVACTD